MRLFLFFLLIVYVKNLNAARFDISSEINPSINMYSNLISKDHNYNLSYFKNTTEVSFTLKNIALEKTDSYMDVYVAIKSYNITTSSKTINSLYINELKYKDIFINKVYLKINEFIDENLTINFGRMPYQIGNGLLISDNGKGIDGIKFEVKNLLFSNKLEFFYFKTSSNSDIDIFGTNYNKSFGDGQWDIYASKINSKNSTEPLSNFIETKRTYYGISYYVDKNNITYSFEFTKQTGSSKKISKILTDNAYVFDVKASWKTKLPILGYVKTKAEYLKSSGGENQKNNKTFYSYTSKKQDGFEWIGIGNIYKAFAWGIAKTSDTISGLPDNDSGIRALNIGIEFPFKNTSVLSFELTNLKNTNSSISKNIGKEFAFKLISIPSKRLKTEITYAIFEPNGQYKHLKSTNCLTITATAGF